MAPGAAVPPRRPDEAVSLDHDTGQEARRACLAPSTPKTLAVVDLLDSFLSGFVPQPGGPAGRPASRAGAQASPWKPDERTKLSGQREARHPEKKTSSAGNRLSHPPKRSFLSLASHLRDELTFSRTN